MKSTLHSTMLCQVLLSILVGASLSMNGGNIYITPCDQEQSEGLHDCHMKLVVREEVSHLGEDTTIFLREAYHTVFQKSVLLSKNMTIKISSSKPMISYPILHSGDVHGRIVEKEFKDPKSTNGCSLNDDPLPCEGYCCAHCKGEESLRCSHGPSLFCVEKSEFKYQMFQLLSPLFYQQVNLSVSSRIVKKNITLDSNMKELKTGRMAAFLETAVKLCSPGSEQCLLPYRDHLLLVAHADSRSKVAFSSKELARSSLLVRKDNVDLIDIECGKVGSSANAFKMQHVRCSQEAFSCLGPQPVDLFNEDQRRLAEGEKPRNMTATFGYPEDILVHGKQLFLVTTPVMDFESGAYLTLEFELTAADIQEHHNGQAAWIEDMAISSTTPDQTIIHVHYQAPVNDTRTLSASVDKKICWQFSIDLTDVKTDITRRIIRLEGNLTTVAVGEKMSCQVTLEDKNGTAIDVQVLQFEVGNECWCVRDCRCVCQRTPRNSRCIIRDSLERKHTWSSLRCHGSILPALRLLAELLLIMGCFKAVFELLCPSHSRGQLGTLANFAINVFYFFLQPFILLRVIRLGKKDPSRDHDKNGNIRN